MKVILTKEIKSLGKSGEIKDVKDGYAKFLIGSGSAKLANATSLNELNTQKEAKEFHHQEEVDESKRVASVINEKTVVISLKAGGNGNLFGAVTSKDIACKINEMFASDGVKIDKHSVRLDKNIKECGVYKVDIRLVGASAVVLVEVKAQ